MFVLVIVGFLLAAIIVALNQGKAVEKGELVVTLTYYESGTKKVQTRYSYFSNGRIEKYYYTGGPPSLRWTKPEKIQALRSILDARNIWNRSPGIHHPLNPQEKQYIDVNHNGETNRFLHNVKTTPIGPSVRDEVIRSFENGKTNTAEFFAAEHAFPCLVDPSYKVARHECIVVWNTAYSGLWQWFLDFFG